MSRMRVLIVRPDRIGDVVLSTPIPREIKKKYPESFVAVLLKKYTKDIYVNNPHVDKILVLDDIPEEGIKNFWEKVKEIKSYNFTHSLSLIPNERLNYILFFSGIKKRYGVGNKFYQFITNTKGISRNKYIPLRHEADYCMDLARAIGVETSNIDTEIFFTDDERINIQNKRTKYLGKRKKLIGVHSTSGNSSPNWTPSYYKALIDELKINKDYQVVVTDNKIPEELFNIDDVIYPNINLPLRETLINIGTLDLLISASTGPMHMAAAIKVRTISLFCPMIACSPELWGPKGNESIIIKPESNYCENQCPGDPKICTFEGDGGITVKKVLDSIKLYE